MRYIFLFCVGISLTISAAEHTVLLIRIPPTIEELAHAIDASDLTTFESLFSRMSNTIDSTIVMPGTGIVIAAESPLHRLYNRAIDKVSATQHAAYTCCNKHVLSNIGKGFGSLCLATLNTALFIYTPLMTCQCDSMKNIAGAAVVTAGAGGFGFQQLRKAFNNEDAINEYARARAIKLLLARKVGPLHGSNA